MLPVALESLLQQQLTNERWSAAIYLGMAYHFKNIALDGMAHWMEKQSAEEMAHFAKQADYLVDRSCEPMIDALKPVPSYLGKAPVEIFALALAHEQEVTAQIQRIYTEAKKLDDATAIKFEWYALEQVEEERALLDILSNFTMFDLWQMDQNLGKR